mgnify:CR=1 FL=1
MNNPDVSERPTERDRALEASANDPETSAESASDEGPDEDPLVVVDGLRTYYESEQLIGGAPVKAVDGVSFEIGRGETFGLVGESGCGKTTLGRSILRLEDIDEGSVTVDGTDVTSLRGHELKQWRRDAQMVFQNPSSSINERMTVGEIVREPLDIHGEGTKTERREKVSHLLDRVGLQPEHYYRYPHQFSGGQRQRIGIARALALEPEFVVLDEPVSALDVSVQAKVLNLLMDLQDEFDLTYLLIAHDLSVVRHVSDRVGVMYLGKLMEVGPTEQLFQSPENPYTRSLLSAIPAPDPDTRTDRITLHGTPPSPRDPPAGCAFSTRCPFKIRPEEFADLDADVYERVEEFRTVVREQDEGTVPVVERLKARLGLDAGYVSLADLKTDLFDGVALPPAVEEPLDRAVARGAEGDVAAARGVLDEAFGAVCEVERPDQHSVDDGQTSRCHRHRDEYVSPDAVDHSGGDLR